jgi:hypothetical protein
MKWPDGQNANSIGYQFRQHVAYGGVSTGTFFGALTRFDAGAPYGYNNAAYAAGIWTPAGSNSPYSPSSLFTTYAQAYRIVSFGVIIRCVSSTSDSAGYLILGTSDESTVTQTQPVQSISYAETETVPIVSGLEVAWISHPIGNNAREFRVANTSTTSAIDWTSLSIELVAAKSTTVIDVEVFLNVEFTLAPDSGISQLVPRDPPENKKVTGLSDRVKQMASSVIDSGVEGVEARLKSLVREALKSKALNVVLAD